MSPFAAYLLGLITSLIILISFWYLATINASINTAYASTVCYSVCAASSNSGLGQTQ
jgi:hypothetical protein